MLRNPSRAAQRRSRGLARCIAITTAVVGLADFVQSYLLFSLPRHRAVIGVFQGPATGLLGRSAMQGGARTAVIGTLLHFGIALAWTVAVAVVFRASPGFRRRTRSALGLIGLATLVGVVVWLTMDWVVLRFSRAHYYPLSEGYFWLLLVGHVPFVGFPLVWGVSRLCTSEH
jgi:hypothetical protein